MITSAGTEESRGGDAREAGNTGLHIAGEELETTQTYTQILGEPLSGSL